MKKNIIILPIVLFLLAFSVSAAEDFSAAGTQLIQTFQCSPSQARITVTNTGTVQSTYFIFAEGEADKWTAFSPDYFILAPGQSRTVTQFVSVPCDAEEADYHTDTIIQAGTTEKVIAQNIAVRKPQNILLVPKVFAQDIMPCAEAEFSYQLHNPGLFTETYNLRVENSVEETSLSAEEITLEPGENKTVFIKTAPSDCSLYGVFNPYLAVEAENTELTAEIDLYLQINKTDIAEIAEDIKTIKTTFEPQQAELEIQNTGNRKTSYTLALDGPDWMRIEPKTVTIDKLSREKISLIMLPDNSTPAGKYEISITAAVNSTGIEYTKKLTVNLKKNTFLDRLFDDYLPYTIAGVVILIILVLLVITGIRQYNTPEAIQKREEKRKILEEKKKEKDKLREQRKKEKEERKTQKQAEKAKKQEEKEKLRRDKERKKEEKQKELERERKIARKEAEKEIKKQFKLIAKDEIVSGGAGKLGLKALLLAIVIAFISFVIVFRQAIMQNPGAAALGIVILAGILIIRIIERKRKILGKWKLLLVNEPQELQTKWKKGLKKISFAISTPAKKFRIKIKKLGKKDAPELAYQKFSVEPNVEDTDIVSEAQLEFKVKKSWLKKHNITPGDVKLMKQEKGRWLSISTEKTNDDGKYLHYIAEPDEFGVFAVTGKPKKEKPRNRIFAYIALGVLVILVLALIFWVSTPDKVTQIKGIPAQSWTQDTQHSIDLNKYFKDPDNDPLSFSAKGAEHISAEIIDGNAILTPEPGWSGRDSIVFTATDNKGGKTKSNTVMLSVRKKLVSPAVKEYLNYALVGIIILAIVLALILFRKKVTKFLEE